jgi:hypothetical protein
MKKGFIILITCFLLVGISLHTNAQCALCTRTAQQLGEKPAQGLNSGILYLMLMPFTLVSIIGFRWWRSNGRNV